MGGIIYPVVASWVWGGGILQNLGFKDFAGSGVVHELGGLGGFVGTLILGPRLNVFEDNESFNYSTEKTKNRQQSNKNKKSLKQKIQSYKTEAKKKIAHKVDTDILQHAFQK